MNPRTQRAIHGSHFITPSASHPVHNFLNGSATVSAAHNSFPNPSDVKTVDTAPSTAAVCEADDMNLPSRASQLLCAAALLCVTLVSSGAAHATNAAGTTDNIAATINTASTTNSADAAQHKAAAASAPRWLAPLGLPLRVVRHFDLRNGYYGAGHRGIDLKSDAAQTVYSPTSAVVSFVGEVVDRPVLSLRVNSTTVISMEPIVSELAVGSHVERGQALGTVQPGHCREPCLHLGVRVHDKYVNPLRFFWEKPRLVAW